MCIATISSDNPHSVHYSIQGTVLIELDKGPRIIINRGRRQQIVLLGHCAVRIYQGLLSFPLFNFCCPQVAVLGGTTGLSITLPLPCLDRPLAKLVQYS